LFRQCGPTHLKRCPIYDKETERFYNRNGWEIYARELGEDGNEGRLEEEIIRREKNGQRQWEDTIE